MKHEVIAREGLRLRRPSAQNPLDVNEEALATFDPHLRFEANGILQRRTKVMLQLLGSNPRGPDALQRIVKENGKPRLGQNSLKLA